MKAKTENDILRKLSTIIGIDMTRVTTTQVDTAVLLLAKDVCEALGIEDKNQRKKLLKNYVPDEHRTRMEYGGGEKKSVAWLTLAGVYDLVLYAPIENAQIKRFRSRQSEELVQINHRDLGKAVAARFTKPIINRFL